MKSNQTRSFRYTINETVVGYTQYKTGIKAIQNLFEANNEDNYVDGLYITGAAGVGKTFIRKQFLSTHPSYEEDHRTVIPVLALSMPTAGGGKGMCQAALANMGEGYVKGSEPELEQRLITLLKACGTNMLLVDEGQHLIERNGRKNQQRAADNLKTVMNEAGVSVVLMSTDPLRELLNVNEQLRRRFSRTIKLRGWDPKNDSDVKEVANVFATFMDRSGVNLSYETLRTPGFITRLIYGSDGRIGYIVKLLIEAAMLALGNGKKEMKLHHFEEAFNTAVWDEATPTTNPFSKKFEQQSLNHYNQPFRADA